MTAPLTISTGRHAVVLVPPELGLTDYCDRCPSAQAQLKIQTKEGTDLAFCGHHANRYAEELAAITIDYAVAGDFTWRGALTVDISTGRHNE